MPETIDKDPTDVPSRRVRSLLSSGLHSGLATAAIVLVSIVVVLSFVAPWSHGGWGLSLAGVATLTTAAGFLTSRNIRDDTNSTAEIYDRIRSNTLPPTSWSRFEAWESRLLAAPPEAAAQGAQKPGAETSVPTAGEPAAWSHGQSLWNEAQGRLVEYQLLATRQAKTSFQFLMISTTMGFAIVAIVAWRASEAHTTVGGISVGAIGVVAGGVAGYISRTFQRTYAEASARVTAYFEHPLHVTNVLSAERMLDHLTPGTEAHDEAVLDVIRASLHIAPGTKNPTQVSRRRRAAKSRGSAAALTGDDAESGAV